MGCFLSTFLAILIYAKANYKQVSEGRYYYFWTVLQLRKGRIPNWKTFREILVKTINEFILREWRHLKADTDWCNFLANEYETADNADE